MTVAGVAWRGCLSCLRKAQKNCPAWPRHPEKHAGTIGGGWSSQQSESQSLAGPAVVQTLCDHLTRCKVHGLQVPAQTDKFGEYLAVAGQFQMKINTALPQSRQAHRTHHRQR